MKTFKAEDYVISNKDTRTTRYTDILKLSIFCTELGIPHQLKEYMDGYVILFKKGDDIVYDIVQHVMTGDGINLAISCEEDYNCLDLEKAKEIIKENRARLCAIK